MSKVWLTIMQDNEGNLMALDRDGSVVMRVPRTKPANNQKAAANKWSEELVTDIHQLTKLAIVLVTRRDHEESRF